MAESRSSSRAVTAGISCAVGVALPACVFAATIPFEGAHELVEPFIVPVAVGAVAGVGVFSATAAVLDARARRAAEAEQEAEHPAGERFASARRGAIPKDVPVIKRATDALDEEEAWAEIDALFLDGSPISCDPARSKDIYQIALDELRREATSSFTRAAAASSASAAATQGAAAAASDVTGSAGAPATVSGGASSAASTLSGMADSTAVFMAAAQGPAAVTVDLDEPDSLLDDVETDRLEALASLDSIDGTPVKAPEPITAGAASGVKPLAVGSAASTSSATATGPSVRLEASDSGSFSIPMVDYSGHEDMWAQAIAIMNEVVEPLEVEAPYVPKHARRTGDMPMAASADEARAQATPERDTPKADRRAGREYLSVIPGGTASFALQQAEA